MNCNSLHKIRLLKPVVYSIFTIFLEFWDKKTHSILFRKSSCDHMIPSKGVHSEWLEIRSLYQRFDNTGVFQTRARFIGIMCAPITNHSLIRRNNLTTFIPSITQWCNPSLILWLTIVSYDSPIHIEFIFVARNNPDRTKVPMSTDLAILTCYDYSPKFDCPNSYNGASIFQLGCFVNCCQLTEY